MAGYPRDVCLTAEVGTHGHRGGGGPSAHCYFFGLDPDDEKKKKGRKGFPLPSPPPKKIGLGLWDVHRQKACGTEARIRREIEEDSVFQKMAVSNLLFCKYEF